MTSINRTKKFIEEIEEQSYYIKKVKQFDDVKLDYELYSNSLEFDVTGSTIEVRALKPDGGIIIQSSGYVIAKNKITVDLKREITEADGTAIVEIKIKKDRKQITTFSLKLEIEKSALNSELGKKSLVEILVELDTKLDITNNKISLLDNKNALASTNISNLDSRNNTATSNINTLKQQNISAENNSRDLATKNSTASSNISVLDSKNSLASSNIKNLDSKNTTASNNISTLDSKNNTANSNIRDLDNKNNTASSNINSLNSKNNTATSNIGNLDTRNTTATSNINELKKQNTLAETNSRDLITKNNTAQNTKNELDRWVQENNNIINLDRRVNENTGKINNNSNEISNMKEAITQNRPIIINDDTPIGTIIWSSAHQLKNIDETIWKKCDGSELKKNEYPKLYEVLLNLYGEGSNSTLFKLPNLMGNKRFIRAASNLNELGQLQDDEFKSHKHNYISSSGKAFEFGGGASEGAANGHTDTFFTQWATRPNKVAFTTEEERWRNSTGVGNTGGEETRPKNIHLIPLIKCKNRSEDMIAVAQEWTNFKENGGEINGILSLGDKYLKAKGIINENTELGLGTLDKKIWFGELGASNGEFAFRPQGSDRGIINLGWSGFEFKNIFLYGYNRSSTGYSKLPNGLILQWGYLATTFVDGLINFPITFPTAVFHVWTDIECASDAWGGSVYQQRVDNTKFRMVHLNKHSNKPGNPIWIAIGH